ncbi:basic amino acid ABC transporter substrate-binding protein [Petroclostridium sp. X23]|uniref:basic amino acid ABC transporter substrate-binding protein n=1 Tax=Petroclostridium sp. X23 TaxID=3045146 RepID=UPI0024AE864E|nr:basic amino acid ABC transporter substrate-binding protein [Petroclostridium sp. X23]WHH61414.1 basic amino acid ABC transporter substrate-binding protein [Petroclostridium sp. X23]
MKRNLLVRIAVLMLVLAIGLTFAACGQDQKAEPGEKAPAGEKPQADAKQEEAGTMSKISKNGTVVMGTNAEFPPFEYRNDKGEVDGFDAAMAKEIAKELGVELKIEDMAFDSLLNALKSGKIDFVAAGMSVTPDRLQNVDFSEAYYTASQKIIVKKDNADIKGKADLEGKKIGVQEGTTGDLEASKIKDAKLSRFKKGIDAIMDLKNGKVDAVVIDASPAEVFVSKNDDLKIIEEELTQEEYAIAVRKGDRELLEKINKVIKDLKDSGKYDELVTQYIGE